MRTVIKDEIYGLDNKPLDKIVDFMCFIPKKYKLLCDAIKHVDTRLREQNGKKSWRVQGYMNLDDLKYLLENYPETYGFDKIQQDMMIGFSKDMLEIWSLTVPYVEQL